MDREHWANAMILRDEPKQRAVAVEAPGTDFFNKIEPGFLVQIHQPIGDAAGGVIVRELERVRTEPLNGDDGGMTIR